MTTVAQHIRFIQIRIETIADKESLPGETGMSLDETLAALTEAGCRRVAMLLDRIRAFRSRTLSPETPEAVADQAMICRTPTQAPYWDAPMTRGSITPC